MNIFILFNRIGIPEYLNSFKGELMVPGNRSRKSLCFQEEDRNTADKKDECHKSGSLETSHFTETPEYFQQAQTGQVVDDTPENLLICMECCGTCQSLPFPPEPLLFCARGCSQETVSKKSCNCPSCPIYKKYRLQNLYFCETGKAAEKKEHKQKAKV